eukprot:Mycagemm_TRINITY_DN10275_c0_g1::TRINITY_DN10275_c0_g1_i3::g.3983::m.3983 type:complete len:253 gc:universal TRINITY_DN10275_c0_g1_i3:36-794(+)
MAPRVAVALFVLLLAAAASATLGVDFSKEICESIGLSQFQCLASHGYSFAVIEAWQAGGGLTTNIASNVRAAFAGGLAHCDVYIFLCPGAGGTNSNPAAVVQAVMSDLSGVPYGMIWFDVEQQSGCWSDAGTNAQYLANMVNAAVGAGAHIGVYSSEYEWSQTVGTYSGLSAYPQWYAHYDDNPSFSDSWAYSYGGWTSPAIKQFTDQSTSCFTTDQNWYPDSYLEIRNKTLSKPQPLVNMEELRAHFAKKN